MSIRRPPYQKPPLRTILNPAHPLAKGLQLGFLFNEQAGNRARNSGIILPQEGTFSSTPPTWVPDGLLLGTNKRISLGTAGETHKSGASPLTLTFRGKFSASGVISQILYCTADDVGAYQVYFLNSSTVRVYNMSLLGANNLVRYSSTTITLDKWTTLTITWNGGLSYTGLKIYINGKEVDYGSQSSATDGFHDDSIYAMYLFNNDTLSRPVTGTVSHFFKHGRVLSEAEIQWLVNEPYAMFEQPRRAKYFDYVAAGGAQTLTNRASFHRGYALRPVISAAATAVVRKAVHKEKSGRPELLRATPAVTRSTFHKEKAGRPAMLRSTPAVVRSPVHKEKAGRPELLRSTPAVTRSAFHNEAGGRPALLRGTGLTVRKAVHREKSGVVSLLAARLLSAVRSTYHYGKASRPTLTTISGQTLAVLSAIHHGLTKTISLSRQTGITTRVAVHKGKAGRPEVLRNTLLSPRKTIHHGKADRNSLRALYVLTGIRPSYIKGKSGRPTLTSISGASLVVSNAIHHAVSRILALNGAMGLHPRKAFHREVSRATLQGNYLVGVRKTFHKEKSQVSTLVRDAILSVSNAIHDSLSGRPAPSRECLLTVKKAVHNILSEKIDFFGAAHLVVADAIHRQLTGKPALTERDRFALISFIAKGQTFSVDAKSTGFSFKAKEGVA